MLRQPEPHDLLVRVQDRGHRRSWAVGQSLGAPTSTISRRPTRRRPTADPKIPADRRLAHPPLQQGAQHPFRYLVHGFPPLWGAALCSGPGPSISPRTLRQSPRCPFFQSRVGHFDRPFFKARQPLGPDRGFSPCFLAQGSPGPIRQPPGASRRNRNSLARLRRAAASSDWSLPFCERGESPLSHFPPNSPAANGVRCHCFFRALGSTPPRVKRGDRLERRSPTGIARELRCATPLSRQERRSPTAIIERSPDGAMIRNSRRSSAWSWGPVRGPPGARAGNRNSLARLSLPSCERG